MDDTEDIDPFAYKPLKVTKKRTSVSPSQNTPNKKQKTGGEAGQRRKSGVKSQKSPRPSQKGPGIVQLFAQMRKTPVKVRRLPSVCPLCQLPLDLLRSPSLVTSRVHLNDCQDRMSESGTIRLPPCPDWLDCHSRDVVHYARFDHSELARHRDLGLNSNQPDDEVVGHDSVHQMDHLDDEEEEEGFVDTGQSRGAAKGRNTFTLLRGRPNLRNTSLADQQSSNQPLKAARRQTISCGDCNKELESTQEKISHTCNRNSGSVKSGPPSVSLLAARSPAPSPEIELSLSRGAVEDHSEASFNLEGDHDRGKRHQDEGEILESHSEVAGPSGIHMAGLSGIQGGQANTSPPSTPPHPIRIAAEKDSEELEFEMEIDPSVHCTKLRVRVPLGKDDEGKSLPLSVSANYTTLAASKQKSITDYFGGGRKSSQEKEEDTLTKSGFEKVVERAKKKGFLAPSYTSLEEKENGGGARGQQKCPWWKLMKDTNLAVDAFSYGSIPGISNYLLSHFHYDHYMGMSRKWSGRILCSSITARLAMSKFKLSEKLFLTIEPEEERVLDGVLITALDANHCPGSLMFVLRTVTGLTMLHTGDFRACPEMESYSILWNATIDRVYLDTTYCKPEYDLPSQGDVIARTVELVAEFVTRWPDTAVLVGAYSVGKERIFKALAKELDARLWTTSARSEVWKCLRDPGLLERKVDNREEARVQVVDNKMISWGGLARESGKVGELFRHVLGVKPTGWTHGKGQAKETSLARLRIVTKGQISLLEVPYSEHSSYSELERFLKFLRIKDVSQVVPTVNRRDCQNMERMFQQWIEERTRQGPDSQQVQIDSQQIERVLKQQSLVQERRSRKVDLANASLPQQQGEDVRKAAFQGDVRNSTLQGVGRRRAVEAINSTCSVA